MQLLIETQTNEQYRLLPQSSLPRGLIAEDQTYRLRLVADEGDDLAGCHLFLGDVDCGSGRYDRHGQISWRWDVSDYVGEVRVGVERENGTSLLPVQDVIVDPHRSKLTRDQFAAMVDDINAKAVIAYSLSPAAQRVELGQRRQAFNLAQLEYIRRQIKPLRQAVQAIARRPRRALLDETEVADLACARAPDDRSLTWLFGRPGELVRVAAREDVPVGARVLHRHLDGHLPLRVQVGRRRETYDVYENQLLKHFLHRLNAVLRHTQDRLVEASSASDQQLDERVIRLARRRLSELKDFRHIVYNLLELGFLQEVSPLHRLKPVTPTLRKDPLYASFYTLYRQFNRAITPFDGAVFNLSLEKTWQLYEYWCFFQVVEALRCLTGDALEFDARAILEPHADRISLCLPEAKVIVNQRVHVHFQRSYRYYGWRSDGGNVDVGTYSHEMRPDISIELLDEDGQVEHIILLDPKYRASDQSLNQAMDELHRYKDAIVGPDRRRLVRTALALCPNRKENSRYFRPDYIRTHGLGAWALSPGDAHAVESLASNLDKLISARICA